MTRLANQEKAGYYPTPNRVTEQLIQGISADNGGRILDPCAGAGEALLPLAARLKLEPYGVEIAAEGVATCRKRIKALFGSQSDWPHVDPTLGTRVLKADIRTVSIGEEAFNLLYLNPPYDYDPEADRTEFLFLKRCTPMLQIEGVMLFVVPRHLIGKRFVAEYLAAHYRELDVYQFPEEEYERFKQIVVSGRRVPHQVPDDDVVDALMARAPEWADLPGLDELDIELPGLAYAQPFEFSSRQRDLTQMLDELAGHGASQSAEYRQHLVTGGSDGRFRPLTG